ncbi:Ig-like domain-containing protein, partial [Phaeodactylibacter sp.]|uniref:Ig-like domain-containing protein n=1 Tax=Phaeodactylibacter sp. TaxID=1940289 RepID=UPI0025FD7CB9
MSTLIKKIGLGALVLLAAFTLKGQENLSVRYGLVQDTLDPLRITAVAISDTTIIGAVTIPTAVFAFQLPAGTATDPAVLPAPSVGSFDNHLGIWSVQYVTPSQVNAAGGDSTAMMGYDLYQVVLQPGSVFGATLEQGIPRPLFSFRLPDNCIGNDIRVLDNDSPPQQTISSTFGANFNNEISIAIGTGGSTAVDRYLGNEPTLVSFDCPIDPQLNVPIAEDDFYTLFDLMTVPLNILDNDDYGGDGIAPNASALSILSSPAFGAVFIDDNGTPLERADDFIRYEPISDFTGTDQFQYQICDSTGDCDDATVTLERSDDSTICPPPLLFPPSFSCTGEVVLRWASISGAQSYDLQIIGPSGATVVSVFGITDTVLFIGAGTLEFGVDYVYYLTVNCSNGGAATSSGHILGELIQEALPEIEVFNIVNPACPGETGSFDAVIADNCSGVYSLQVGNQLVTGISPGETVSFSGLTVADDSTVYYVSLIIEDNAGCQYDPDCLSGIAEPVVFSPFDTVPPTLTLYGPDGSVVNDQDTLRFSALASSCSADLDFTGVLTDNCTLPGELGVSVSINNSAMLASGYSLSLIPDTAFININAAIGLNTLNIQLSDGNGNELSVEVFIDIDDIAPPTVSHPDSLTFLIPPCEASVVVDWMVFADDLCDPEVEIIQLDGPVNGSELTAGVYNLLYEAIDDFGNTTTFGFPITVLQTSNPAPIVDVSGNGQFVNIDCAAEGFVVFSGNIYDCEIEADEELDGLISISGAPLEIT